MEVVIPGIEEITKEKILRMFIQVKEVLICIALQNKISWD